MPIKLSGRYEPGSDEERAHNILVEANVDVDRVYSIESLHAGMEAITFTYNGRAQTAFVADGNVFKVEEGWDVPPPPRV